MSDTKINKNFNSKKFISENSSFIFMNIYVDIIFYVLILSVVIGSWYIYISYDKIMEIPRNSNPNYTFPNYAELSPSILYSLIMILVNHLFRKYSKGLMTIILSKRYLTESEEIITIYKNKLATNIFKFCFYLSSTIMGFYVLKDLDFFPSSMLGKGHFSKLFDKEYPNYLYLNKPDYFNFHCNYNLAFAIFDLYLLITNPLQSDFLIMVFHHFATISLITFSYVCSYSSVGSIIYYVMYLGDIFSYLVRVSMHSKVPILFSSISTCTFIVIFSYTRLYVFGYEILYTMYNLLYFSSILEIACVMFLFMILLLNILWIIMIVKKYMNYLLTGNIEEIYKLKINKKSD